MYLLGRFFDLALRLRLVHNAKFLMKTPKVFRNSLAQRVHVILFSLYFFMKQGTETICPLSLRTHRGCPVAGATTSVRSVALKTIDETIYIVPSWGSGRPTTSPKDCVQQSFSMSEKTADTRAMPSLSNTRPSLRVIACGVKFLYFIIYRCFKVGRREFV